ncbi:unnamed protein product [Urochloa humidicola]
MDVLETLPVRFHFNGEFISTQKSIFYCGGREEMSYIDRDKVSLPEIFGHLKDHCNVHEGALLHWLYPGKEMVYGLRVLVDDKSCIEMANTIVEGGVAEIYVEAPEVECDDHQEDQCQMTPSKVTTIVQSREDIEKQNVVPEASSQPSVAQVTVTGGNNQTETLPDEDVNDSSDSDSDYLLGDEASSEDDDEATEILTKFKQFKKNLKDGEPANLDDVVLEKPKEVGNMYELHDDGNATSYEDSSGDEDSVEELSDGQVVTKSKGYPRYNNNEPSPRFELGMKFSGKKQFKKAVAEPLKLIRLKCANLPLGHHAIKTE